jgi:transaldolase
LLLLIQLLSKVSICSGFFTFVLSLVLSFPSADSFDEDIAEFAPEEGTTNPSLILQAAKDPAYAGLVAKAVEYAKSQDPAAADASARGAEYLSVLFGAEIYKITGRVATEIDVTLSFDTNETIAAALRVIDLYSTQGIPKEAIRVKISATWEGIQAARVLESQHGISCLVTIVFGLTQAIAAAEAGVSCIAPYVGRIGDWYRVHGTSETKFVDMGVKTVQDIQNYLRKFGYSTKMMAASFRNTQQVRDLAGADLLTISPQILRQFNNEDVSVEPKLTASTGKAFQTVDKSVKERH